MVNKGTVYTNTLKQSRYYVTWEITSQSTSGNYSDITWKAGIEASNNYWYNNAMRINSIVIDGTTVLSGGVYSNIEGGTHQLASGTKRIYHNTNGEKNITVSINGWLYSYGNCSGSDSFDLTTIPRYANITNFIVEKVDETSVKFNWSADASCDYAWYSKDNGSTWNNLPTTDIVSGLSANTTYKFKLRVKRTDSQLTTDSSTVTQTTYSYPYCNSMPDFTIGNRVTLGFYNPLGREFTFYVIANGTTIENNWTISDTSYNGLGAESTQNQLYATIPNKVEATYKVGCVYESTNGFKSEITKIGGVFSITGEETPIFSDFSYRDSNTTVTDLTGNDQVLVKGQSTLEVTISSANKMVTQKSATPDSYGIGIDTLSVSAGYSEEDIIAIVGTPTSSGTKRLNVRAIDSRILSTLAYKDVTIYDYAVPTLNVTATRTNNFEEETTLKVSGTYDKLTIDGENKNTVTSVQYRTRETDGEWSDWTTISTTVSNGKFTCNDVVINLDNTKSFDIRVRVIDKLSTTAQNVSVDVGVPIFFISSNKKECYINNNRILTEADIPDSVIMVSEAETNLDDYMVTGYYFFGSDYTPTNIPAGVNGWLQVIGSTNNRVKQIWYRCGTVNSNDHQIYVRTYIADEWSEWSKVSLNKTIYTGTLLAGETVVLPNARRFLEVYARINFDNGDECINFIIDTDLHSPSYGSGVVMAFDESAGLDYYVAEAKWNKNANELTYSRAGFFKLSTGEYTERQANSSYYIYRVDTYD